MPPVVATWITLAGVLYLLRHDAKFGEARNPALWLPVLWLSITGSRFVSQWMDLGAPPSDSYDEGSAIDALYFAALITAACWVLVKRQISLFEVVRNNKWLVALFVYGLLSIAWSDFPFVALKRWIKTLGHPLMALIILTDPDPAAALRAVFKRCAFLLLPVSVLFIKYLPEYGRGFDSWTGEGFNNGVGLNKNGLGYICMAFAIFFSWNLLSVRRLAEPKARWREVALTAGFMWMTLWLLQMSNSATSLSTALAAVVTMLVVGWRIVSKRYFVTYLVITLAVLYGLESAFDIYASVVEMLGRDPTLTDRTSIWEDVLALQNRPIFGFGFESFWLGPQLEALWEKWTWHPNQAHNGYIETYLNLGLVGVGLLGGLIASTVFKIAAQMQTDFAFARLRLAFLIAIAIFNYTEAAFKGVHFIWTLFHLVAIDYVRREAAVHQAQDDALSGHGRVAS